LILFVIVLVVFYLPAWLATRQYLRHSGHKEGKMKVINRMSTRNLGLLVVVVIAVAVLALVEGFSPDWHATMIDAQYALGATPFGTKTYGNDGGTSWMLYGSVLLGTLLGLIFGTRSGYSGFPAQGSGLTLVELIWPPASDAKSTKKSGS
jgi:hypothetical protein